MSEAVDYLSELPEWNTDEAYIVGEISEWRQIPDFPDYEVSSNGQVRSFRRRNRNANEPNEPRYLVLDGRQTGGYPSVTLRNDSGQRSFKVHHLVASVFIGPRPSGMDVCHNNDNPLDNRVANLRYDSKSSNQIDKQLISGSQHVLKHFDEYSEYIHRIAKEKHFWDGPNIPDVILCKLALVHSEVSEVLEAYRKEQGGEKIAEEFADVYIRLVDLWSGMRERKIVPEDISLREVIISKVKTNSSRPTKHGNLI